MSGQYGWNDLIKGRVAGQASQTLTTDELDYANMYASDIVDVETDRVNINPLLGGWDIRVNQTNGDITTTEPFAMAISSITNKIAGQSLRFGFDKQEMKSSKEYEQAMMELAQIKIALGKLGYLVSTKTVTYTRYSTNPSDPDAPYVSGIRRRSFGSTSEFL
jgi:hypothetical protein